MVSKEVIEQTTKVWDGEEAIRIFRNHRRLLHIPIIRVPDELNPYREDGIEIFAKDMSQMPLGTVKSGPAFQILEHLDQYDLLRGKVLVEPSSGNMGAAMAAMAPHYGVAETIIIVSPGTTEEKKDLIKEYGATVWEAPDGIRIATQLGSRKGFINPNQYKNDENWRFTYEVIGPQIWRQMDGDISLLCAGIGSGGTVVGLSRYLKEQDPEIRTLGVVVEEGHSVPGVRTLKRLEEVGQPWKEVIDWTNLVTTKDAFGESLKMNFYGLNFGPSSGFAQIGLLNHIQILKERGELDMLRNAQGKIRAVYIAPDGPELYTKEYSKYSANLEISGKLHQISR